MDGVLDEHMSANAQEFQGILTGRSSAPLSQGVVAGLVGLLDASSVMIAGWLVHLGIQGSLGGASKSWVLVAVAATVLVLVFNSAGMYRFPVIMRPARNVSRMVALAAGVAMALVALGYALEVRTGLSRASMLGWLCLTIALVIGLRLAIAALMVRLAQTGRA